MVDAWQSHQALQAQGGALSGVHPFTAGAAYCTILKMNKTKVMTSDNCYILLTRNDSFTTSIDPIFNLLAYYAIFHKLEMIVILIEHILIQYSICSPPVASLLSAHFATHMHTC
jgi:hypothetical protein